MASAGLREELNCSICLSIYTDPVNLRCGHNYCRGCIDQVLDDQRGRGFYTCPECRKIYTGRPELQKNITLCNIAERFLSAHSDLEETGVSCTYCIHSPVPAVKSCLMCEACLCANHLRVHSKSEEHVLVEASSAMGNKKCPIHKKLLEYYCVHDSVCICVLCKQDGKHRGHLVEMIYNAANKKKERLRGLYGKLTHMREETERDVQSLQKDRRNAKDKASAIIQRVSDVFSDIMDKLQDLESQVIGDIRTQVEQNTKPISGVIQKLEIQRDELSGKLCYVEELRDEPDPLVLLQEQETNRGDFCLAEKCGPYTCPIPRVDEILISLQLQNDLADLVEDVKGQLFVPENSDVELDDDTAARNVDISPDAKVAFGVSEDASIDDRYDCFESHQVLSITRFSSGIHYWEVDIHGYTNWRVGMSYYSIPREGRYSVFGNNEDSWCLCKTQYGYSFRHDGEETYPISPHIFRQSKRLGIYLDYEDGRLSFYHLGHHITHLYTFDTYFTEPLYAAIRVGFDVRVRMIP